MSVHQTAQPPNHGTLADAIARLSLTLESLREIDAAFNAPRPSIETFADSETESSAGCPTVAVHCLGAFRILLNGKPIETWRAIKPRALFQYLVSHRQRSVPREALIDALWPDPENSPAGTALKVVVHRVRKLLRVTAKRLEIQATEDGYRLDGPGLWVDVEEFERCSLEARRYEMEGHAEEAALNYARAAAIYRGDFLEDVPDEWVVLRRERLKDMYLLALARLADAAFSMLDFEQCIEHCQQILAHDPCREQAYRVLMLCYARLGQRGRVRRWYEVCMRTLRGELDVDPEPETRATYEQAMLGSFSQRRPGSNASGESPTGNRQVTRAG
jgi:DNA-binding SARP family transcriptional activator